MNKLRHLAISCTDPRAVADSLQSVFDMTLVRHEPTRDSFTLTDGYLHLDLFKSDSIVDSPAGLHHVGFEVDDLAAIREHADDASVATSRRFDTAKVAFFDLPDGWHIEVRERGWDEMIAAHTDSYDLALVDGTKTRTLQVSGECSAAESRADEALVRVGSVDELPPGAAARVECEGHTVFVVNVDGDYFAVQDQCSHLPTSGRLSDSGRKGCIVECHTHLAQFDVRTGEVLCGPARKNLRTYEVAIHDGALYLSIEPSRVAS